MKFLFCGGDDCPDWVLWQIDTLSSLPPTVFKEMCSEVIEHLAGSSIDFVRLLKTCGELGPNFDRTTDLKACIAGFTFIIRSAVANDVFAGKLEAELVQLGLIPELASLLVSQYLENFDRLKEHLPKIELPSPSSMAFDYVDGMGVVTMTFVRGESVKRIDITMTLDQVNEMRQDPALVQEINPEEFSITL